jgi:hypothetical protein
MERVTLDEIIGIERYEAVRSDFRARIIELKKRRRVPVGECVTFVFENHDTVLFQIQEMVRAERITDLDKIRFEIDTYNALIPGPSELSATMLIEITEQERIREELLRLLGIDEAVWLEVGKRRRVRAEFEPGRSREDKLSAVQYVRFPLDEESVRAFRDESEVVRLVVDHPNYRASAVIDGAVRRSLAEDLASAPADGGGRGR